MKESQIMKAAIVQQVCYVSEDAMYRINVRKIFQGMEIKYLSIDHQEDGSVIALIQLSYNGKEMFDRCSLLEVLRRG